MSDPYCQVCRGRRSVVLPLYPQLEAVLIEASPPEDFLKPSSKTFPCPECEDQVTIRQVQSISEFTTVQVSNEDALRAHTERGLAHACVDGLIRGGFFKFEHGLGPRKFPPTTISRATLLAVPVDRADTLDKRIAKNRERLAVRVRDKAIALIQNWGSYYHRTWIEKDQAYREIDEAYKSVLEEDKDAPARDDGEDREFG